MKLQGERCVDFKPALSYVTTDEAACKLFCLGNARACRWQLAAGGALPQQTTKHLAWHGFWRAQVQQNTEARQIVSITL
jgi:hypothetical protein